jgi:hypothetical protein
MGSANFNLSLICYNRVGASDETAFIYQRLLQSLGYTWRKGVKSENELDGAVDSVGEWARSDEDISGHSCVDDDPATACGGVEY